MSRITCRILTSSNRMILSCKEGLGHLRPMNNGTSHRTLVTLREKHKTFLKLVGHHGAGSVKLTYDYPKKIATLSLTNESVRNALSGKMMSQLASALDDLLDDDVKNRMLKNKTEREGPIAGLILRSSGRTFSAGADLNLVKDIVNTSETGIAMSQFMNDALIRIRSSGLISVCLINGTCIGGGAELATVCDYRLMTNVPLTHICFVHSSKGASPGWGGGSRLVSIVGRQHALKLLATSSKTMAADALQIGLIDGIVELKENTGEKIPEIHYNTCLQEAAENLLLPYTSMPFPASVAGIKTIIASSEYLSKKHVQEVEQKIFAERWGSKDREAGFEPQK